MEEEITQEGKGWTAQKNATLEKANSIEMPRQVVLYRSCTFPARGTANAELLCHEAEPAVVVLNR